jgi:hypothetical protein
MYEVEKFKQGETELKNKSWFWMSSKSNVHNKTCLQLEYM